MTLIPPEIYFFEKRIFLSDICQFHWNIPLNTNIPLYCSYRCNETHLVTFREEPLSELIRYIENWTDPGSNPLGAQPGFGTQNLPTRLLLIFEWNKNETVINIGLVRLLPWQWPKLAVEAATTGGPEIRCS